MVLERPRTLPDSFPLGFWYADIASIQTAPEGILERSKGIEKIVKKTQKNVRFYLHAF